MDYKVVKDNRRKKMVMQVDNDGTVIITVPKWTRKANIERFYKSNLAWIAQRRAWIKENHSRLVRLTRQDIARLKEKATAVMTAKTAYYGRIMGVMPDKIKITSARKRWGSCNKMGDKYTICYSYRTMFLSEKGQDYIAVHELAHMKHFDHSKAFYAQIEEVLPDWRTGRQEANNFKDYHIY